ncbi:MAG: hypothetical protein HRU28_19355 [Rhizobiales bacterium]|nr:hypothetical protein [Hyphomicrobiales bacterium]
MKYKNIVRGSGFYDLFITAPFMFPTFTVALIEAFKPIGDFFGLERTTMVLTADTLPWISLMATIVTVWSVLRILNPDRIYGLYDAVARFGFSFWFVFYPLVYLTSELTYLFLPAELAWGIVQLYGYWKIK